MRVVVVTKPEPIVSWAEAKEHLRLSQDLEKALVERLVAAATIRNDGPAGRLGIAIGAQKLEILTDCFSDDLRLFGPVLEIESVQYLDDNGAVQTVPSDIYEVRGDELCAAWGKSWPYPSSRREAVRIRYWAGYGKRDPNDTTKWVNDVPETFKVAVLLYVGAWFENREETAIGVSVAALPDHVGAEALLHPYKVYR